MKKTNLTKEQMAKRLHTINAEEFELSKHIQNNPYLFLKLKTDYDSLIYRVHCADGYLYCLVYEESGHLEIYNSRTEIRTRNKQMWTSNDN